MKMAAYKYTLWRKARENPGDADPQKWPEKVLKQTQRRFIAEVYQRLMNANEQYDTDPDATEAAKKRFPHPTHLIFGYDAKDTTTVKSSYPDTFKRYFTRMVKSIVKINGKTVHLRKPPPMVMSVGAKDGVDKTKNVTLKPFKFGEIVDKLEKP